MFIFDLNEDVLIYNINLQIAFFCHLPPLVVLRNCNISFYFSIVFESGTEYTKDLLIIFTYEVMLWAPSYNSGVQTWLTIFSLLLHLLLNWNHTVLLLR